MTNETKKLSVIIGLIIVSILVGVVDRVQSPVNPSASVIPKSGVMVIPVEGMITATGSQWEGSMVDIISDQLDEAKDTKSVKAIILRINSPGGTVGAAQEIYNAVIRLKMKQKTSNRIYF